MVKDSDVPKQPLHLLDPFRGRLRPRRGGGESILQKELRI